MNVFINETETHSQHQQMNNKRKCGTYTVGFYLATRKKEIVSFAGKKMNGAGDHHVKCNKLVPSRQELQASSHVEGSSVR